MAHPLVATSAFSRRAKHSRIVGLGVFVVSAGLVSFGPGINGGYFFDDFLYVYLPSAGSWTDFFGRASGTSHAYRPLEAIILSWIQNHFGWSTWPIHALCFSLHSALAMLTYATARILGLTSLQAGIATIFLMVSQSTVSAVLGNDCLSQVLATTFGFASTFLFWRLRTQHPN